ncbi:ABC transporter permease [Paenibacillus hodogayensis]|uniref:ABC transporter permease n=1 Tax=Paenibacillus hodogayensis TaxID=279208 RepID=A0ABV5VYV7_9BACL
MRQTVKEGMDTRWNGAAAGAERRRYRHKRLLLMNVPLMMMFIPVALYFAIFKYAPMVGLVMAFKQYSLADGIWASPWVGLQNFELLFSNPQMLNIIRNTLVLSLLKLIVGFPFPIVLAILLNEVRRAWFKKVAQTLVYLPHFLNWVIVGGMVITLFSLESGLVNKGLELLLGYRYAFLYNELSWIAVYLGSGIWKEAGFSAIIYLAAITAIDPGLYESASLDGANKWKQMWHITLPGIRPTIVILLILSTEGVMDLGFDQIYMLQNRVVNNIADVIPTYMYRMGIQGGQFSLTTAMGLFSSLVGLVMITISNQIAKRFNQSLW